MRYTYKAAWTVVGGMNLPKDTEPRELFRSDQCRFVLTNDPDDLLAEIDRSAAVGRLMLKGLVGQAGATDFVESEVAEIRAERTKSAGAQTILVIEASGEIDASITEPFKEHDAFIVTFDAVNKQAVVRIHQPEVQAMKLAVAFESETPSRFFLLSEGTYLTNDAGKIVFSVTFTMSADLTVSSALSEDGVSRISKRYTMLQNAEELESVERLFSQMSDYGTDRLKVFLSGWAALEIFFAKSFKIYENAFFSPLASAGQPILRERFLNRIKDVMKDKYRLTDKFLAVAAVLFPNALDKEIEDDFKQFSDLKKLRNSISHRDEFIEKNLPVHELAKLLRKYVLAHVATPHPAVNTDAAR